VRGEGRQSGKRGAEWARATGAPSIHLGRWAASDLIPPGHDSLDVPVAATTAGHSRQRERPRRRTERGLPLGAMWVISSRGC
jgi:hypothetical protein